MGGWRGRAVGNMKSIEVRENVGSIEHRESVESMRGTERTYRKHDVGAYRTRRV